jgi:exopolysaccharide production protein ExoQ
MSKASMPVSGSGQDRSSRSKFDACTILPILACLFATVVAPVILFVTVPVTSTLQTIMESRWDTRIFWPLMAVISLILVVRHLDRLRKLTWPPHIICLFVYLAFAGLSVGWAFKPELSVIRYLQQVMVQAAIILPAMLAVRRSDMMYGVFLCYALGAILNVFFVINNDPSRVYLLNGYPGYFMGKNYLGEFAAVVFILALHEAVHRGFRRVFGIIVVMIAVWLLVMANSKTALGLAFVVPCLAGIFLVVARTTRISPAILIMSIPVCYAVLASITGFNMNRLSYMLYGDPTFTGRTIIWDFANYEISRRPLIGWGYQSFWLVGPDAPSIVDAPGFVKAMPNAHNGYKDTMLELGYVGLALLLTFITATLHAIGRVAKRDLTRAWLLLSLALYVIIYNFLESLWMRGFEVLWVLFLIVAVEAARYWQPSPSAKASYGSRAPSPGNRAPARGALRPR